MLLRIRGIIHVSFGIRISDNSNIDANRVSGKGENVFEAALKFELFFQDIPAPTLHTSSIHMVIVMLLFQCFVRNYLLNKHIFRVNILLFQSIEGFHWVMLFSMQTNELLSRFM